MNKIKAVVFDLGGVIIKINWSRTFDLWKIGADHPAAGTLQEMPKMEPFLNFEKGLITSVEFHHFLQKEIGLEMEFPTFIKGWNACLGHVLHGIDGILHQLKNNVPIYALSNTNLEHEKVFRHLAVFSHFTELFLSHNLGFRKPELDIYQLTTSKLGLYSSEILFIDDLLPNLEGAKACGWNVAQSLDSQNQTKNILKEFKLL
jgi:putative hydrolase of the HAD superfamily